MFHSLLKTNLFIAPGNLDRIFCNTVCVTDVPCLPEKVALVYKEAALLSSLVPKKKDNVGMKLWYNKVCWAGSTC